jgi:hypothetical protein
LLLESCFYFDASVGEGLGRIISMISFSMPEWCMAYPFQYFSIRPLGAINIKQGWILFRMLWGAVSFAEWL